MKDYEYGAYYKIDNTVRLVSVPSIADVKEGFWLDKDLRFVRGSAAHVWIAPGSIMYVIKIPIMGGNNNVCSD